MLKLNKFSYYILLWFFFVNILISISFVIFNINLFQLDTVWHIASWSFFANIWFHNFNDKWFLWYVNNLFYPPLEDFIVYCVNKFVWDFIISFKIFFSLVLFLFFFSFYKLSKLFDDLKSKIIFLILVILFFNIDKGLFLFLQWLSNFDALYTWLTSQFLSWSFLFLLIYELLKKWDKNHIRIVLYCVSSILSHIVVGPVSVGLVFVYFLFKKDKRFLIDFVISFMIGSFFILPFVFYKDYITSSKVLVPIFSQKVLIVLYYFIVFLSGLFISLSKNKDYKIFWIFSLFLLFPQITVSLLSVFEMEYVIPDFHFYRFWSLSFIFSLIIFAKSFDQDFKKSVKHLNMKIFTWLKVIVWVLLIVFIYKVWVFYSYKNHYEIISKSDTKLYSGFDLSKIDDQKRILTLDHFRSIDFNLDSYLSIYYPDFKFVKWLFWESTKSNAVLGSYMATLFWSWNIVTNYSYLQNIDCERKLEIFEKFISDYAIWWLISAPFDEIAFFLESKENYSCYDGFIDSWSLNVFLERKWTFFLNNTNYNIYKVNTKNWLNNELIEVVSNFDVVYLDDGDNLFFSSVFKNIVYSNLYSLKTLFLYDKIKLNGVKASLENITWTINKLNNSLYNIEIKSDKDVFFKIKFAYFPWFKLYDENWDELDIYRWSHYILWFGKGKMTLIYQKSSLIYFAYWLSILGVIIFVFYWRYSKK